MKYLILFFMISFLLNGLWAQEEGLSPSDFFDAEEVTEEQDDSKQEPQEDDSNAEDDGGFFLPEEMGWGEEENSNSENNQTKQPQEQKQQQEQQQQPKDDVFEDDEGFEDEGFSGGGSGSVGINEERGTQRITISGSLGLFYVFREDLFSATEVGATDLDSDFFDPRLILRLDIQLKQGISAVIELQNEVRNNNLFQTNGFGSFHFTNRQENLNAFEFEFEKAYVEVSNFLLNSLNFKAGIIPYKYALRANGDAFFIDLGEAESPFAEAVDGGDTNARGVVFEWKPTQALDLYIDGFYLDTFESGFDRRDQKIYGVNIDLYLGKSVLTKDEATVILNRNFNIILAAIEGDNKKAIWSVGFGADYFLSPDPDNYLIEIYGEAIFQFGEFNRKDQTPNLDNKNQAHLAFGGYLGTRFVYTGSPWRPYVDVSVWYISGDDDDPNRNKNNDLVTFEDIDSTLIIEENDFGFDIDSNYWAIKFESGISLKPLLEEDVRLELLYAHFEAIDVSGGISNNIGEEIDIRLVWEYTSDLTFALAAGILFNSEFLQQAFDDIGANGRQSVFLLRLETILRF